ncbi:hypothetical protein [Fulvimarina sp. MAC8]|uniref:hypothetical protein n=1 Tax=Fulvimarina sp. MAC8 TaxID=3162874 RepID=UPI0032EE7FB5
MAGKGSKGVKRTTASPVLPVLILATYLFTPLRALSQAAGEGAESEPRASRSLGEWCCSPPEGDSPNVIFVYVIIAIIIVATLWLGTLIEKALRNSPEWSLAKALSETALVPVFDDKGRPVQNGDQPVLKNEYQLSTSRLIAFTGSFFILMLFIGFGLITMYWFAFHNVPDQIDKVVWFMFSGITLFVPYAINRLTGWRNKVRIKEGSVSSSGK